MRRLNLAIALPLLSALILLADRPSSRLSNSLQQHMRGEVARLQAHFDSVDGELKGRDVSKLSKEQLASRTRLAAWLRDYRDDARFPLNDGVASSAVPIFRDSRGVLCAMAYLIQRSGRPDIVDDVAASRNTASVFELADDPRLVAWLDSTGLTLEEAARIQPTYERPRDRRLMVDADYAIGSVVLGGTAFATGAVNLLSPSRTSGVIGLIVGTLGLVNGVVWLANSGDANRRLAGVNTAIGALSIGAAFRGFIAPKAAPTGRSSASRDARFSDVALAPTVVSLLGKPQVGFTLSARF
jgi:hypothetical protein